MRLAHKQVGQESESLMDNSVTFMDYIGYFFTGYKTESMNQATLTVLRSLHYVIIAFLAITVQQIYDAATHGTFDLFNWQAWQSYVTPGAVLVLGLLNEALRKGLNPSVSLKELPSSQAPRHFDSPPRS